MLSDVSDVSATPPPVRWRSTSARGGMRGRREGVGGSAEGAGPGCGRRGICTARFRGAAGPRGESHAVLRDVPNRPWEDGGGRAGRLPARRGNPRAGRPRGSRWRGWRSPPPARRDRTRRGRPAPEWWWVRTPRRTRTAARTSGSPSQPGPSVPEHGPVLARVPEPVVLARGAAAGVSVPDVERLRAGGGAAANQFGELVREVGLRNNGYGVQVGVALGAPDLLTCS